MEAEIATIRMRYRDKIENLQSVLKIARKQNEADTQNAIMSGNSKEIKNGTVGSTQRVINKS